MLTYNNRLKQLILPEYGRNIQNMVDHCATIENRDERNLCAATIVDSMRILFPPTGDPEEYERKLWDHVIIMSNFTLDIDMPYEGVTPETFDQGPEPVPLMRTERLSYRHYGQLIPRLIDTACSMEDSEARTALITLIANQMKKTLLAANPEGVDDSRIYKDLRNLSHGAINVDAGQIRIHEYKQAPTPSGKKKKKK